MTVKWKGWFCAIACAAAFSSGTQAQQQVTLRMQATWPATFTLYDNFTYFVERVGKISGGSLKVEPMPAGKVVPAFEVLEATHKKMLDGAHSWSVYWVSRNKTAILFTGGPGGTYGMDFMDALGWMHHGGGIELANEFFQKELKLNVVWLPIVPSGPQAFGWFKRPIRNLADLRRVKCRQTGMAAEVWQRMGIATVNMPGSEIIAQAQRGAIDCAEWVGGVEDMRLGLHNVWKYHYAPGMHENTTIGEIVFNADVWKALSPTHQEIIKSAANEAFLIWWTKWQKQNAEALKELQEKHGVRILRTPPDILTEFLKTWDKIAAEEEQKNPFFKKVHNSQKAYASLVVPAKRFYYPPYSFAANHYFPEAKPGAAKAEPAKN